MTIRELSQLYYLKKEIELETNRMMKIEQGDINGLRYKKEQDPETDAQIEDCKMIIEAKRREAAAKYNRLCRFIKDIDDSMIRQIISLRYLDGCNWTQVAMKIGGGNTAESVKKACYRYIKKSCPECPGKL